MLVFDHQTVLGFLSGCFPTTLRQLNLVWFVYGSFTRSICTLNRCTVFLWLFLVVMIVVWFFFDSFLYTLRPPNLSGFSLASFICNICSWTYFKVFLRLVPFTLRPSNLLRFFLAPFPTVSFIKSLRVQYSSSNRYVAFISCNIPTLTVKIEAFCNFSLAHFSQCSFISDCFKVFL